MCNSLIKVTKIFILVNFFYIFQLTKYSKIADVRNFMRSVKGKKKSPGIPTVRAYLSRRSLLEMLAKRFWVSLPSSAKELLENLKRKIISCWERFRHFVASKLTKDGGNSLETTIHSSSDSTDSSVDKTSVDDFMQMLCMWKQILEDRKTTIRR